MTTIEHIRAVVPRDELLAQLAEEATELAHAALKLRRAEENINPTPVDAVEALNALHEEIADVELLLCVLELDTTEEQLALIGDVMRRKAARWVLRMEKR